MNNLVIYCADIGSVKNGKFAWARLDHSSSVPPSSCNDINSLVNTLASDLRSGRKVALGFECPLFVPITEESENLTSARQGEGNRPFSAGAGAGSLVTGLTETVWVLEQVRRTLENQMVVGVGAFLSWDDFHKADTGLFLWEAFVSGNAKGSGSNPHCEDAMCAVMSFNRKCTVGRLQSEITCESPVHSLIGAALLRTGWKTDISILKEPCIVIKGVRNVIDVVANLSKIPSFTTYEDRLLPLIEQYTSKLPFTTTRITENNLVISWPGNLPNLRPVALTAHLDKINHFGTPDIDTLPVAFEDDEIVGQLDDAVGVAICLHVLSECNHIRNCPPIMILLSEMEEKGSYWETDLLRNNGEGIDLSPGAGRIADYLISQSMLPEAVITIDTSAVFRRTGGVALYTNFWEQGRPDFGGPSPRLLARTAALTERIMAIDPEVLHANGTNDYITYGKRLNEPASRDIPSIAIEPAIWPIHDIGERMKVADIHRVSSIVLKLLKSWVPWEHDHV